jgi:hypothetical protein
MSTRAVQAFLVKGIGMAAEMDRRELEISESDRSALGIGEAERLAVAEVSRGMVLLERIDCESDVADAGIPSLRFDLAVLPLAAVLNTVHDARRSGLLRYSWREHEKTVYLHRGEVVFASSNQRVDRLGECLLRAGVISLEQLREAERCFSRSERFGKVLVERGFLTPRELWNGVKYQVEEIVRSLFAMPGGTVCFWEGEVQPDNVVRLSLETGRLVSEGIQRSAELRKFLAVLEDGRVRLAGVDGFNDTLAGSERAIADAIGAERAFGEVCEVLDVDRESAARSIQLLRLVGAVKLMRLPEPAGVLDESDLTQADDEELRLRVGAMVKLLSEMRERVAAADGDAEGADNGDSPAEVNERLARVLDDATGRFPALLTGISLNAAGSLDPDVLVDRALKLPGDREEQLIGSLGELIAYLEFEIKNHPSIDEPDEMLAGLESLRRQAGGY